MTGTGSVNIICSLSASKLLDQILIRLWLANLIIIWPLKSEWMGTASFKEAVFKLSTVIITVVWRNVAGHLTKYKEQSWANFLLSLQVFPPMTASKMLVMQVDAIYLHFWTFFFFFHLCIFFHHSLTGLSVAFLKKKFPVMHKLTWKKLL